MARICNICDERELPPRGRFPSCSVCRGNMGGWVRRGVAAILAYRRKLQIRETRMEYLVEDESRDLTQKQRQRIAAVPMGSKPIDTELLPRPSQRPLARPPPRKTARRI